MKKLISILSVFIMVSMNVLTPFTYAQEIPENIVETLEKTCDINGDGEINEADINMLSDLIDSDEADVNKHDFNGDGEVDVTDVVECIDEIPDTKMSCDINEDGEINKIDINMLINLIDSDEADVNKHDFNGDGEVDVTDVVECIDEIPDTKMSCDINEDGETNKTDINMLINLIDSDEADVNKHDFNGDGEVDVTDVVECIDEITGDDVIVTFDVNRGTIVESQVVASGSKVTRPANPEFPGYSFGGWYSDEDLTQSFDFNSAINRDTTIYAKWVYQGIVKDLNVYFIKDGDTIDHFTIMDRNLGASEVYNQDYENPNTGSYGYYYQRGNNYGFSNDVNSYIFSSEQVPYNTWSKYMPSKYASSRFIMGTQANFYNWMEGSTSTDNIWGGRSDNVIDKQGPCPTGYHVPSKAEWEAISNYWYYERGWGVNGYSINEQGKLFASIFLMPFAGTISFPSNTGEEPPHWSNANSWGTYWSSTNNYNSDSNPNNPDSKYDGDTIRIGALNYYISFDGMGRADGISVRCFKDTLSPEITINQSGGKNAIIAIDGDRITTLQSPVRDDGKEFKGWYADQGFTQKIETGSIVPNELFAKWEGDESINTQVATLLPGNEFRFKIRDIMNYPNGSRSRDIKSIKKADNPLVTLTSGNLISIEGSPEVYAWFDNTDNQGIIYYYTDADEIYLNKNSANMFDGFDGLQDISGLSGWNASNVTEMGRMFYGCSNLSDISGLSGWNTSSVTSMGYMFYGCSNLSDISGLSGWDTSNVTNMYSTFYGCSSLSDILGLGGWNTSNVTEMGSMFEGCSSLTDISALSGWNTSKVTSIFAMFRDCSNMTNLSGLSRWNTNNVTNMYDTFYGCSSLSDISGLSGWNTSNVTHMGRIFGGCSNLSDVSGLGGWNTSNVTEMGSMFEGCSSLTDISALSGWNTSSVTNMGSIFRGCSSLSDISALSGWNTSSVRSIEFVFKGCSSLTDIFPLVNWNTNNVTTMRNIFEGCNNLTGIDLSNWDTSNVYDMSSMFKGCSNLSTIYASSKFNLSGLTYSSDMFSGNVSLVGGNGTPYDANHTNADYARIDKPGEPGYFTAKPYTITFNSKGGTVVDSQTVVKNGTGIKPTNPIRTGYYFKGWYVDPLKTTKYDFNSLVTGNITLYAKWQTLTPTDVIVRQLPVISSFGYSQIESIELGMKTVEGVDSLVVRTPLLKDGDDEDVWQYYAMLSKYPLGKGTGNLLQFTPFAKENGEGFDIEIDNNITGPGNSGIESGVTYYGVIVPKSDDNVLGVPSQQFCFNIKSKAYALGDDCENLLEKIPMKIYGNIRIGLSDLNGGTLKVYNSSNQELASYDIIQNGKYGSDNLGVKPLLLNKFDGSLIFKVSYNGKTYIVDSIDDSNRGYGCPSKSSITFVPEICRYDIVLKEEQSSSNQSSSGISGGGGSSGGGGKRSSSTTKTDNKKNTTIKVDTEKFNKENNSSIKVDTEKFNRGQNTVIKVDTEKFNNTKNYRKLDFSQGNSLEILGNGYTREQNNAYSFSYVNGITSVNDIKDVKVNGPLTRIAMAKMLSQYAINVLGKIPDTSKSIEFDDVSSKLNAQYDNGVVLAYQLGIMGQNMKNNEFRPNDEVSRAEFVTALSRMLYGMEDGKGNTKYYEPHMSKLYKEGIITKTDPKIGEKRGYVMTMLMRSAE